MGDSDTELNPIEILGTAVSMVGPCETIGELDSHNILHLFPKSISSA